MIYFAAAFGLMAWFLIWRGRLDLGIACFVVAVAFGIGEWVS